MAHTREEFQNAISYLTSQNDIVFSNELFLDANARKLYDESHNESTGARISSVDVTPDGPTLTQALIDLATEESNQQTIDAVQVGAKAEVQAIPNYATWTTSQANSWLETNVTDLASAKVALKALATMVIAMRNELYPDLQD